MYYVDELDRYFEDIEDTCEYFWNTTPQYVPEFIYGTKKFEVDSDLAGCLVAKLIEYLDSDVPEAAAEDEYFSDRLGCLEQNQLIKDIQVAVQKVIKTCVPDYTVQEPLREAYIQYCQRAEIKYEIKDALSDTY